MQGTLKLDHNSVTLALHKCIFTTAIDMDMDMDDVKTSDISVGETPYSVAKSGS